MTPRELKKLAVELYGENKWHEHLADAINVDRRTVFRWMKMAEIPDYREAQIKQLRSKLSVEQRLKAMRDEIASRKA